MFVDLKHRLSNIIYNIPGWRTKRHIVVIESDDWGAIRMPSRQVSDFLHRKGIPIEKCPFCSNDSLERKQDLERLFEVLLSVRDQNGRPCKITANCVMANPDFKKIKEADFLEYHYESILDTFGKTKNCEHVFESWIAGRSEGIWSPQFHGREHLNVAHWLRYLQQGMPELHLAFKCNMFGLSTFLFNMPVKSFMAALDARDQNEMEQIDAIIRDGLHLFKNLFGATSTSFIAPNYIWSPSLETVLAEEGVKYIQGGKAQLLSDYDFVTTGRKKIRHYIGQKSACGLTYLVRNCNFEPTSQPGQDHVALCMAQIRTAFRFHKPAIINTHRVNYIGAINPKNSDQNLRLLKKLLLEIIREFPDVEFLDSSELGMAMN